PVLAETSENASTFGITAQTSYVYTSTGEVIKTSNPTRGSGESTDGWTRTTRDRAGRTIEVASFSGATEPPTTGTNGNFTGMVTTVYNADQTTVTDQAGKGRRSVIDGLGR